MLTLTFRVTLKSDYHVGSGHRAGPTVDSALLRDHDQALLLRGSMLAGLLRDGLADLCDILPAQLQSSGQPAMMKAAIRLFGDAARRKGWAFSSARAEGSAGVRDAGRWGAQDVMRTRIDPRTRRAAPQQLFSQEEGDARARFVFTANCPFPTAQDARDAALLVAAARMVRRFGSARRRGRGACEISLVSASGLPNDQQWTQDAALDEFKAQWLDSVTNSEVPQPVGATQLSLSGAPIRFRIIARADEPVIVARRAEAANAYETLSAIPGTTLLGALADLAAKALGLAPHESAPEDFVALFYRGGVSVTGLLPAEERGLAGLHVALHAPHDLLLCEAQGMEHPVITCALRADLPDKCPKCGAGLAALPKVKPFYLLRRRSRPYSPPLREEAHIRLNRDTGRVRTGNLYEYIALEAGQWFVGELSCANDDCWRRLCELTGLAAGQTLHLRLGKASRRGYGLVTLFLQQVADSEPTTWTLRPLANRVTNADEPFSMLLLCDAIVADEWGRYEGGFAPGWLAQLLKVREDEIELLGQFASARVIDTFNAARRAPRWRDEAIVAGSVVGIRVQPSGLTRLIEFWRQSDGQSVADTPDALTALRWRLRQIEAEGIGWRTNEGFGRIAFNHPVYAQDGGDDLERGVSVDRRVAGFTADSGQNDLVRESLFRRNWAADLARWEDEAKPKEKSKGDSAKSNRENWEELTKPSFEPVARLLYLSRQEDAAAIIERLKSLSSEEAMKQLPGYLWGKKLPERGQEPKLSKGGVRLLCELVTELQQQVPDPADPRWAIGLKLLAARIAESAGKGSR